MITASVFWIRFLNFFLCYVLCRINSVTILFDLNQSCHGVQRQRHDFLNHNYRIYIYRTTPYSTQWLYFLSNHFLVQYVKSSKQMLKYCSFNFEHSKLEMFIGEMQARHLGCFHNIEPDSKPKAVWLHTADKHQSLVETSTHVQTCSLIYSGTKF